ncbi:hypothetical protein BKG91_03795 [Rodentibacter caecimuris]|uniref:Uncharacterized protein n=2 Tax=Rodentibacter caecimuris TaxID=1796644 RepID=A0AAJ3K2N2_9PAST|nr:hypothetical protein BKG90_09835 [Rodentibacter heylii]OOF75249.1 hypothetical protein BKG91_03795 [Rodentibacter heylii]OOF77195.1 hypothetical protein BKG99_04015 [Rodentibacter heylii]
MRKNLLFLALLFCNFSQAQTVPDEIVDLFDEVLSVADPEEDVNYKNYIFSVKIDKSVIQRDYAKYIVSLICEDSYSEPDYWRNINFKSIEVRNRDNNSGFKININKDRCAYFFKKDLSDYEIEQQIFKYELQKF